MHKIIQKSETHYTGFLIKREIEVDHTLPAMIRCGDIYWIDGHWTLHGKTSVTRQWTEKSGKNGLSPLC